MPLRLPIALAALAAACALPVHSPAPAPLRPALAPNDPFASQWLFFANGRRTRSAWDETLGSPAVTIAVVDTGVEPIADLTPNLVPGHDFVDGRTQPFDGNGHGTAMASIAAARTNNGIGIPGICGLCTVMPVRVAGSGGLGTDALAAAGIRWAAAHGARVINLSMTSRSSEPELAGAIEDAVTAGAVVVIAAGNEGAPSADFPGQGAPDAITVAGVDQLGRLLPWSNHGAGVDVAAPGQLAALSLGGGVFPASGTSAAAAFVSGVAGLMLSANPALTPEQVNSILLATGTPTPGLDVASGSVVDVRAAVDAAYLG